ncbi:putative AC9 transposase [Bienertia sinuspersici]
MARHLRIEHGLGRKARREALVVAKVNYTGMLLTCPSENLVNLLLLMNCPLISVEVQIMSILIELHYNIHIEEFLGIPLNIILNKHTMDIEIDGDWLFGKRIICFEAMEDVYNGFNIKTHIINCCKNFHLLDKIFSLSLNIEPANTKATNFLKEDPSLNLLLNGSLLHIRYITHILNLYVQESIAQLQPLLESIRSVIKWIRVIWTAKRAYKTKRDEHELRKKLLYDAIRYREVLIELYNESWSDLYSLITNEHSEFTTIIRNVIASFDNATNVFFFYLRDKYTYGDLRVYKNCEFYQPDH